jgi:ABC-type glycerol-3-phosphate transport system substrate-binding protein
MKTKTTLLITIAIASCIALFALTSSTKGADGKTEKHPKIHHAIVALEQAKVELKTAAHDFGGHREAALKECDAAIAQLKQALEYDKK